MKPQVNADKRNQIDANNKIITALRQKHSEASADDKAVMKREEDAIAQAETENIDFWMLAVSGSS